MKKIALVALTAMLGCGLGFAGESSVPTPSTESAAPSPQVCQFSLTDYSGTTSITYGNTEYFKVGLSCPQKEDVRATVFVKIDGETVASQVVTIKAGNVYSDDIQITTGHTSKSYTLEVQ